MTTKIDPLNHLEQLLQIKAIIEYASSDIQDYDDESETLQYHSEKLLEAANSLEKIITYIRNPHVN